MNNMEAGLWPLPHMVCLGALLLPLDPPDPLVPLVPGAEEEVLCLLPLHKPTWDVIHSPNRRFQDHNQHCLQKSHPVVNLLWQFKRVASLRELLCNREPNKGMRKWSLRYKKKYSFAVLPTFSFKYKTCTLKNFHLGNSRARFRLQFWKRPVYQAIQ